MYRLAMLAAALTLTVAVAAAPSPVLAAPTQQACTPGTVTQHDLAGYYQSTTMRLTIYPCGGSYLEWDNAYGTHNTGYKTTHHLSDGVVAVVVGSTTNTQLDSSLAVGYKAAERGYLQVITAGPLGERVYLLRKMY